MAPPPVVVCIGAPSCGKTTLVSAVARSLAVSYCPIEGHLDALPPRPTGAAHRKALAQRFRQATSAARGAIERGCGALIDGCVAYELALVDLSLRHGRLSKAEAAHLHRFGELLQRHSPDPDVVIHLDTTAEACLARSTARELALEDHASMDAAVRRIVDGFSAAGCDVYSRPWDRFGKASVVRDTILCATPGPASTASRRLPSPSAVERLLSDLWAASAPARRPAAAATTPSSPEMRRARERGEALAPLSAPHSPEPMVRGCSSSIAPEGSPASVLTREEDMRTILEQLSAAA